MNNAAIVGNIVGEMVEYSLDDVGVSASNTKNRLERYLKSGATSAISVIIDNVCHCFGLESSLFYDSRRPIYADARRAVMKILLKKGIVRDIPEAGRVVRIARNSAYVTMKNFEAYCESDVRLLEKYEAARALCQDLKITEVVEECPNDCEG